MLSANGRRVRREVLHFPAVTARNVNVLASFSRRGPLFWTIHHKSLNSRCDRPPCLQQNPDGLPLLPSAFPLLKHRRGSVRFLPCATRVNGRSTTATTVSHWHSTMLPADLSRFRSGSTRPALWAVRGPCRQSINWFVKFGQDAIQHSDGGEPGLMPILRRSFHNSV